MAILLIVFTHGHAQAGIGDPLSAGVFYTIDRLGVPIFFMISGGLILDKIKEVPIDFTGSFLLYFLIGYLVISRDVLKGCNKIVLYTFSIVRVVIPSCILVSADVHTGKFIAAMHWYNGSLFIVLSGTGLLILINLLFENTKVRFLEALSLCALLNTSLKPWAFCH
ncbi:hypothetical protein ACGVWS_06125 [Enterobacteriaceae bacterium LUAb1]